MSKKLFFFNGDTGTSMRIFDTYNVFKRMFSIVFIVENETTHRKFSFLCTWCGNTCKYSIREAGWKIKAAAEERRLPGECKAKQSARKYVCPGCGRVIRATKEVNVICGDCEMKFEEAE